MKGKKQQGQLALEFPHAYTQQNAKEITKATPFLKWAGGKRGIMPELLARLPKTFNDYYEPFAGGGALFFELQPRLRRAFLSDANPDLICTYQIIRDRVEDLIELLSRHRRNHNEHYFYEMRQQQNLTNPVEIAARMIYLNKTCFNGLWRVNKKGEFNVGFGKGENPGILQQVNLERCARALSRSIIACQDYKAIKPKAGDFVYFDPPYHSPKSKCFTAYTQSDFTEKDQAELAAFCILLHQQNVKLMMSNSDTDYIRELYNLPAFNVTSIKAPRIVNCKGNARTPISELLVTNCESQKC